MPKAADTETIAIDAQNAQVESKSGQGKVKTISNINAAITKSEPHP
jgi:hypothetical protein